MDGTCSSAIEQVEDHFDKSVEQSGWSGSGTCSSAVVKLENHSDKSVEQSR